tara:strand:+ start:399 stop:1529 length:1131 start_codon:yes stop_codon:yes gene_type:complete
MLVISDTRPDEEMLDEILGPWHEFECTGRNDQYVQNIDKTIEAREEFRNQTVTVVKLASGEIVDTESFYREMTPEEFEDYQKTVNTGTTCFESLKTYKGMRLSHRGLDQSPQVLDFPEGSERVDNYPVSKLEKFTKWASDWYELDIIDVNDEPDTEEQHKYGWVRQDELGDVVEIIDRTNPNAKWDWWQIGGRYGGRLQGQDCRRRSELDLNRMHEHVIQIRNTAVDEAVVRANNEMGLSRQEVFDSWQEWTAILKNLRTEWEQGGEEGSFWMFLDKKEQEHPQLKQYRNLASIVHMHVGLNETSTPIEEYLNPENVPIITAWGIVKDGEWFEQGEMGWWGLSSNNKDMKDWDSFVTETITELDEDKYITVVDCHI